MFRCPNCGNIVEGTMCPYCGYTVPVGMMGGASPEEQLRMYKTMRNGRLAWRFIFVLFELASFGVALLLCWLFTKLLDTDVFYRHSYLVIVVWVFIAYKIYQKMKQKIS